jgi:hypothetical protein
MVWPNRNRPFRPVCIHRIDATGDSEDFVMRTHAGIAPRLQLRVQHSFIREGSYLLSPDHCDMDARVGMICVAVHGPSCRPVWPIGGQETRQELA